MNRIVSRILAALMLWPFALFGQTATLPQGTTTQPVIPAGTTLCTVPKNGGACRTPVNIPLPALTVTFAIPTIPVSLSGYAFSFTIDLTHATVSSDGKTITGAVLNIVSPSK